MSPSVPASGNAANRVVRFSADTSRDSRLQRKLGMGELEIGGRPRDDAVTRFPQPCRRLNELLRCHARQPGGFGGLLVDERAQHRQECGQARQRRRQRKPFGIVRQCVARGRRGGIEEDDPPRKPICEQAFGGRDKTLDEAREAVAPAVADEHDEVGAILHLRERGGDPAGLLQDVQVAVLRRGAAVIDDRAQPARECKRRAHAGDVGAETADERPACASEHRGCGVERRLRTGRLAAHARSSRSSGRTAERCERGATPLARAVARRERGAVGLDGEVVAQQAAERAGRSARDGQGRKPIRWQSA